MSNIKDTRWAMGLGIKAGKALVRAEDALSMVQATAAYNLFNTVRKLRDARLQLNKLAKEISHLVDLLEKQDE